MVVPMPHLLELLVWVPSHRRSEFDHILWAIIRVWAEVINAPVTVATFPRHFQRFVDCTAEGGFNLIMCRTFAVAFAVGRVREMFSPALVASASSGNPLPTTVFDRYLVTARVARKTPFSALNVRQSHEMIFPNG